MINLQDFPPHLTEVVRTLFEPNPNLETFLETFVAFYLSDEGDEGDGVSQTEEDLLPVMMPDDLANIATQLVKLYGEQDRENFQTLANDVRTARVINRMRGSIIKAVAAKTQHRLYGVISSQEFCGHFWITGDPLEKITRLLEEGFAHSSFEVHDLTCMLPEALKDLAATKEDVCPSILLAIGTFPHVGRITIDRE